MSEMCQQRKCGQASFDHLVGGGEQFIGHGEAERLRGLEVKRMSAAPRRAQARDPEPNPGYWILAKASTCTRKSESANCGTATVALVGEGGPK
jgi:hypothetical protein